MAQADSGLSRGSRLVTGLRPRHPEFRGFLWDQFEFVEPFALIRGALETFADFAEYLVDYRPPELSEKELGVLELLWKRGGCDSPIAIQKVAASTGLPGSGQAIAAALGTKVSTRSRTAADATTDLKHRGLVDSIQGSGTQLTRLGKRVAAQRFGASPS